MQAALLAQLQQAQAAAGSHLSLLAAQLPPQLLPSLLPPEPALWQVMSAGEEPVPRVGVVGRAAGRGHSPPLRSCCTSRPSKAQAAREEAMLLVPPL